METRVLGQFVPKPRIHLHINVQEKNHTASDGIICAMRFYRSHALRLNVFYDIHRLSISQFIEYKSIFYGAHTNRPRRCNSQLQQTVK